MYTDDALIDIADKFNICCSQYPELMNLSASQLVVVGEQSSGKSSVLNNIIGFNVLPTNKDIVTRTPIPIKLINSDNQYPKLMMYVQNGNEKMYEFQITIDNNDKEHKLEIFRNKMVEITAIIAGSNKNISEIPICLNIYWNKYKTNLSFVDLPGRVLITRSDQSESIKQDIDNLIKKYLLIKNTIALVVVQSRTDLVTNSGLALFKEIEYFSKNQIKAIGILTKPDAMPNEDIHVLNDFVMGRIDKKVQLSDGYFILNNRTENEELYFTNTFGKTSDIVQNERYGIIHLNKHLKTHLIRSIKSCLPIVKNQMLELLKQKQYEYQSLGGDVLDNQNKQYFVNKIITDLCEKLKNSIDSKMVKNNVGYSIGESIDKMTTILENLTPFGDDLKTTKYFQNLVKYSRGYRLTSQSSLEEMIESCLKEIEYDPTNVLIVSVRHCITEIEVALTIFIQNLINSGSIEYIQMYPEFKDFMYRLIKEKIHELCDQTIKEIQIYLKKQKCVIWSTDSEFSTLLKSYYYTNKSNNQNNSIIQTMRIGCAMDSVIKSSKSPYTVRNNFEFSAEQVKTLSIAYYKSIIVRAKDMIPQDIIFGIILKIKNEISGLLLVSTLKQNLNELLNEDKTQLIKKTTLKKSIDNLSLMMSDMSNF